MMRFSLTLVLAILSLCAAPVFANRADIEARTLRGVDALYSMQFEKAVSAFDSLRKLYPKDPTGEFFIASTHLWGYVFDKKEADLVKFLQSCDKTIALAEAAIDANPNDSYSQTIIGAVYGFRSIANVRSENFLKASWDARNCYKYLHEVVRKNPQQYEAYLGLGIFNVALGSMPAFVQSMMNLSGMEGNTEKGIKQLELAAQKAVLLKNDAQLILGLLYVYYNNDYGKGLGYLQGLMRKYPTNIPLLYAIGNIESQLKRMPTAVTYFDRVIQLADKDFSIFTTLSHFRLGEAWYRLNDFEKSKKAMQRFVVKSVDEKSFRAIAFLRLGVSYEMQGDRENAVKAYKRVADVLKVTAEDRYAGRKAEEYLAKPLSADEKNLIRGVNAVESLKPEDGLPILQSLLASPTATAEQKAEAWYSIGEAHRLSKQYPEALNAYQKVVGLNPKQEKWLLPWSFFRMSQVAGYSGDKNRSRTDLQKAKAYSGYDFQEWLMFQIERDIIGMSK